jgi:uncharacterized integral membrane protein
MMTWLLIIAGIIFTLILAIKIENGGPYIQ